MDASTAGDCNLRIAKDGIQDIDLGEDTEGGYWQLPLDDLCNRDKVERALKNCRAVSGNVLGGAQGFAGEEQPAEDTASSLIGEMRVRCVVYSREKDRDMQNLLDVVRLALYRISQVEARADSTLSGSEVPRDDSCSSDLFDPSQKKQLESLPPNVQLGLHMLLSMMKTLDPESNPLVLRPVIERLPELLVSTPRLGLSGDPHYALEAHVEAEISAMKLEKSGKGLSPFELRKANIRRRELRLEKQQRPSSFVGCNVSKTLSRVLLQAVTNQRAAKGQSDAFIGGILSCLVGVSVKEGSLSGLLQCAFLLLSQGVVASHHSTEDDESPPGVHSRPESALDETKTLERGTEKLPKSSTTESLLLGDPSNHLLQNQRAKDDLDVESFLVELANTDISTWIGDCEPAGSSAGILYTFGKGDHGKLGHGKCTDADEAPQPHLHEHCPDGNCTENVKLPKLVKALADKDVVKVASLSTHSVVLCDDGTLYTWGNGDKHRLGHGGTGKEYAPRLVSALIAKPRVQDISCGLGHTLALLENGSLWSWGNGANGRLGLGDTEDRASACCVTSFVTDPAKQARSKKPDECQNEEHVLFAKLFCGASHSLAISRGGAAYSWGKNNQGQLGHGDTADRDVPHAISFFLDRRPESVSSKVEPGNPLKVLHMAGGWEHTLGLTGDGKLYSWGSGYKDSRRSGLPPVLGHGGTEKELVPRQVLSLQEETIVYCTCGWDHSMAISKEGHVFSWGAGTNGKLGHGDEEQKLLPQKIESLTGQHVVRVEAGCEHSVAITAEGYLYTWGHGDSGRLGHASNRTEKRPKRVEYLVEQGRPVLEIAVGDKYNLVIVEDERQLDKAATRNHAQKPLLAQPEIRSKVAEELELPGENDEYVPEWMLHPQFVALYILVQLERLASEAHELLRARNAKRVPGESTSPRDSLHVVRPGLLPDRHSQKELENRARKLEPIGADVPGPSQAPAKSARADHLAVGESFPYCFENSEAAAKLFLDLIHLCMDESTADPPAVSDINATHIPPVVRWVGLWSILRILRSNLHRVSHSCDVSGEMEQHLVKIHELLLCILIETKYSALERPPGDGGMERLRRLTALEAAMTIKAGFTRFHPSAESRRKLLLFILEQQKQENPLSQEVLDVLVSNLTRDETMKPLVSEMLSKRDNVLPLLETLLGTLHLPPHYQMLVALQTHVFAWWNSNAGTARAETRSFAEDLIHQYSKQILNKALERFGGERGTFNGDCLIGSLLPLLLSNLNLLRCASLRFVYSLRTTVVDLVKALHSKEVAGLSSVPGAIQECQLLSARLAGRLMYQSTKSEHNSQEEKRSHEALVETLRLLQECCSSIQGNCDRAESVSALLLYMPYILAPTEVYGDPDEVSLAKDLTDHKAHDAQPNPSMAQSTTYDGSSVDELLPGILDLVQRDVAGYALVSLAAFLQTRWSDFMSEEHLLSTVKVLRHLLQRTRAHMPSGARKEEGWHYTECLWSTLLVLVSLLPKPSHVCEKTKSALLEWLTKEVEEASKELRESQKRRSTLFSLLESAAFLIQSMEPVEIPRVGALAPGSPPDGGNEACATKSNDAIGPASLTPPDEVSCKNFAVSFRLSVEPFSEALGSTSVTNILSRCQFSKEQDDDDEVLQSDYPDLEQCHGLHKVTMSPAILLRNDENGRAHLDVLVSTVALEGGSRASLIEYVSALVDPAIVGSSIHVAISVESKPSSANERTLKVYVNGSLVSTKTLRGHVLQKCSTSVPFTIGSFCHTEDHENAVAERCSGGNCSSNVFESILGKPARASIADCVWYGRSLGSQDVSALYGFGPFDAYEEKHARLEKRTKRLLEVVKRISLISDCHSDSTPSAQQRNLIRVLFDLLASSRWIDVQCLALDLSQALLTQHAVTEATALDISGYSFGIECACRIHAARPQSTDWAKDTIEYLSKLHEPLLPPDLANRCACRGDVGAAQKGQCCEFLLHQISGYSPSEKSTGYRYFTDLVKLEGLSNARIAYGDGNWCTCCIVKELAQHHLAMLSHRNRLRETLERFTRFFVRKFHMQKAQVLRRYPKLCRKLAKSGVETLVRGVKVVLPSHGSVGFSVGHVESIYCAKKLLRTFCMQGVYRLDAFQVRPFVEQCVDGLYYDFFIPHDAALAAVRVAALHGYFLSCGERGEQVNTHEYEDSYQALCHLLIKDHAMDHEKDGLMQVDVGKFVKVGGEKEKRGFSPTSLEPLAPIGPIGWGADKVLFIRMASNELRWHYGGEVGLFAESDAPVDALLLVDELKPLMAQFVLARNHTGDRKSESFEALSNIRNFASYVYSLLGLWPKVAQSSAWPLPTCST